MKRINFSIKNLKYILLALSVLAVLLTAIGTFFHNSTYYDYRYQELEYDIEFLGVFKTILSIIPPALMLVCAVYNLQNKKIKYLIPAVFIAAAVLSLVELCLAIDDMNYTSEFYYDYYDYDGGSYFTLIFTSLIKSVLWILSAVLIIKAKDASPFIIAALSSLLITVPYSSSLSIFSVLMFFGAVAFCASVCVYLSVFDKYKLNTVKEVDAFDPQKELKNLSAAYENGVISEAEYEEKRKNIISRL